MGRERGEASQSRVSDASRPGRPQVRALLCGNTRHLPVTRDRRILRSASYQVVLIEVGADDLARVKHEYVDNRQPRHERVVELFVFDEARLQKAQTHAFALEPLTRVKLAASGSIDIVACAFSSANRQ